MPHRQVAAPAGRRGRPPADPKKGGHKPALQQAVRFSPKGKEEDGLLTLETLRDLHLEVKPIEFDLLHKANMIAWTHSITVYDALYVALAVQLGFPFITSDDMIIKKLKGNRLVLPLRDLKF